MSGLFENRIGCKLGLDRAQTYTLAYTLGNTMILVSKINMLSKIKQTENPRVGGSNPPPGTIFLWVHTGHMGYSLFLTHG